ncbi:MAG: translation initiation inhibitor [Nibricoccus sp.]
MKSSPAAPQLSPSGRSSRSANAVQNRWPEGKGGPAQGTAQEYVLTFLPNDDESLSAFVDRVLNEVRRRAGSVLMVMAYGSTQAHAGVMNHLSRQLGKVQWPVLWVEGQSCGPHPIAGFQVFILPSAQVQRLTLGEQVVGNVFSDADARHCLVAGLTPLDPREPRATQCAQFFASAERVLEDAGFVFGDIARTWFYNDEILAWYDDFNRERTGFYKKQKFRSGSLPASTAVRGKNPRGAALTFGAWAVVPHSSERQLVTELASPLQCPAPAYGSSFSRAVEISSGGKKRVLVSGTASIEPGGKTVWQGEVEKQIALTMDVVEAILRPRGLGFFEVTRATAYFKKAADMAVFRRWQAAHGLETMPVVPVNCDICRDDLLFEIELDACSTS